MSNPEIIERLQEIEKGLSALRVQMDLMAAHMQQLGSEVGILMQRLNEIGGG